MDASPHSAAANLAPSPVAAHFPGRSAARSRRSSAFSNSGSNVEAGPSQTRPSRAVREDDEALEDIRRYESFSTVDWIVDSTRERNRIARERQAASAHFVSSSAHLANGTTGYSAGDAAVWGSFGFGRAGIPPRWWSRGPWGRRAWLVWGILKSALSAFTDSGVIVLVGILIGLNMGVISLATEWASDLKQGYCSSGWWLNQKFCCWEMMDPAGPGGAPLPAAAAKAVAQATVTVTLGTSTTLASAQATDTMNKVVRDAFNLTMRGLVGDNTHPSDWWSSKSTRDLVHEGFGHGLSLLARAEKAAGSPVTPGDLSETCTDWVPWSTWTLPAYFVYIIFAGLLSLVCAHLVKAFAPYAAGSGISEIKCILAGFVINGYLGFWTLAIKSLTLPLAIASGLSVGKEGPAVHVACCIGNVVASFFRSFNRSQAKMRELLTAASAAGVAVAFGSPIGGVLFSLEEMAYNFPASTMWRSFLCALAATVTLSFMNPFRTGKLVLFQVSYDRDWHYFEIVFYVLIGIFGGLYGALVIKYNLQVQSFRRNNLAKHGVSEVVVLAVLTAFIGYANKFLRIDMTESLEILFRECEGGGDYDNLCQSWAQWRMVNSLLLATVLRTILVIISYGCKVPAGIFVPSMAIGATFGRMVGILVKALYNTFPHWSMFSACQPDVPCITPGTYAFLGAAAALAGVTRITVAVVVIMFELTGALTYILPTMIVVGITKGVGDWFSRGGIAEQMIKFSGYPFLDKEDEHFFGIPVMDVMKVDPVVLYADGMKLCELESRLNEGTYKGFPVVQNQDDSTLLGYAGKTELRYALNKARRARSSLGPQTLCLFSVDTQSPPKRGLGEGSKSEPQDRHQQRSHHHHQANQELLNMPSLPTTAANDQADRQDMLNRLSSGVTTGSLGMSSSSQRSSSRKVEFQALIGDDEEEEEDEREDMNDTESKLHATQPRRGMQGGAEDVAGIEDEDAILGEAGGGIDGEGDSDVLELAGWIDPTPLMVQPGMALETVMDLFKKMGPRVILVVNYGKLSGLVTVKDVLKRIAVQEKAADALAHAQSRSSVLPTNSSRSAGDGSYQTNSSIGGGELEILLKEVYDWSSEKWEIVAPYWVKMLRKVGLSSFAAGGSRRSRVRSRQRGNGANDGAGTNASGGSYSQLRDRSQNDDSEDDPQQEPQREVDGSAASNKNKKNWGRGEQDQFVLGDED